MVHGQKFSISWCLAQRSMIIKFLHFTVAPLGILQLFHDFSTTVATLEIHKSRLKVHLILELEIEGRGHRSEIVIP